MKRYARIYRALCALNFSQLKAFRVNLLISGTLIISGWTIVSIILIFLMTRNTTVLFGWKRDEIVLLVVLANFIRSLLDILVMGNFRDFFTHVNKGALDAMLLQPVDSQFYISLRRIRLIFFVRVFLSLGVFIYFLNTLHMSPSIITYLVFSLLVVSSLVLSYSIFFVIITLAIWFPRMDNIVEVIYSLRTVSQYPTEMYKELHPVFFIMLLPILILVTVPTRFLLGHVSFSEIFLLISLSVVFFTVSRFFWKFALRSYTSASG